MYQDKTLTCIDCGADFTFTAEEQEFFATHQLTNEPKRCKPCREKRKSGPRGGGGGGAGGGWAAAEGGVDTEVEGEGEGEAGGGPGRVSRSSAAPAAGRTRCLSSPSRDGMCTVGTVSGRGGTDVGGLPVRLPI